MFSVNQWYFLQFFKIFTGIPSGPVAFLGFKDLIIIYIYSTFAVGKSNFRVSFWLHSIFACRLGKIREKRKDSFNQGRARILKSKTSQKSKGRKQTTFLSIDESDRPKKGNKSIRNKKQKKGKTRDFLIIKWYNIFLFFLKQLKFW